MNKKIIAITALAFTLTAGTFSLRNALAQETNESLPPMMQRFSERFGLNKAEVEKFIDENHEQMQEQRKVQLEERLNQAVKDGKISQQQKEALKTKMEENMQNHFREMKEHREEMHKWAEEQGIDLYELNLGHRGARGAGDYRGMGGMRGMGK